MRKHKLRNGYDLRLLWEYLTGYYRGDKKQIVKAYRHMTKGGKNK